MTRLLPRDEYTPECTVKGFHGRYIYAVSKGDLELVSNMAGSHFLLSAYFAMTEESGYVETTKELPPSMKISLELLVKLSEYTTKREATVTECSLTKKNQYGKVFIKDGSEKAGTRLVSPCLKNDTVLSARYTEPQSNAYAAGLFTALDCCLELVSKGVNRRAVCSACQYEFPKLSTDEASLGEDLTLILGVYRFNVEIASPASHASVKYGRKRSLIYASHAQIPKKLIPCELTDKGTKLCFMGIDILPSGIPSFKSFRDVCDRFSDLCASGRVLSAKAAFNGIEEAASALCGRVRVTMSENLCMLPKMGIVFEVESSEGLVEIGALERDPLSADTETEG